MISKIDFLEQMKKLEIAFKHFDLTQERITLFYDNLNEYELNELDFAVKEVLKNNKFAPTIADIREKIEELRPTTKDLAREFENNLFSCDTDTLIRHYERKGDNVAVKVLKNNYKNLRECQLSDTGIMKAQLREQYNALLTNANKQQVIKNNNINIGIENLAKTMLIEKGE